MQVPSRSDQQGRGGPEPRARVQAAGRAVPAAAVAMPTPWPPRHAALPQRAGPFQLWRSFGKREPFLKLKVKLLLCCFANADFLSVFGLCLLCAVTLCSEGVSLGVPSRGQMRPHPGPPGDAAGPEGRAGEGVLGGPSRGGGLEAGLTRRALACPCSGCTAWTCGAPTRPRARRSCASP